MKRRTTLSAAAAVAVALVACAGVLGLRRDPPRRFAHRAHVVAGVSCVTCHPGVSEAGDRSPLHLPADSSCTTECHQQPHDPRPCLGCHADPMAAAATAGARDHLTFSHARHQAASSGNCMRCHQGVAEGDARLRPAMATCWGCHEHDRARDVRDCQQCHVDLAEEGTPPASHLVHEGDFARTHGTQAAAAADLCSSCHQERFCASCHGVTVPQLPARGAMADPFAPSVHRAGFRSRHAEEARAAPGTCSSCHQPERCATCHLAEGVAGPGSRNPHPPGWVGIGPGGNQHGRAARRDPAACASCHGGAGEALCVGCHVVGGVGGNPHPVGFDPPQALNDQPCRMCHIAGAAP